MVYPKKSLGQNFLKSKKILADMIEAGNLNPGEVVLEAGPGTGNLTEALLAAGAKVVAIEKDRRLIPILQEKFAKEISTGKLTLIEADILDFAPSSSKLTANGYKLIANIPYYITGTFIRKFLEADAQPKAMILLVQKEVAERIVARDGSPLHLCHCHKHKDLSRIERQKLQLLYENGQEQRCGGKESILSISVKAYGEPRYVETVKAGNFSPAPKIDSAIISIENISHARLAGLDEKRFFEIVKAGFAHKRKQLLGNLKTKWPTLKEDVLERIGLDAKMRAENLTLENWLELLRILG